MAAETIVIGENPLITRALKQSDGVTDLLLSEISVMTVQLIQDDVVKKTWTYENPDEFTNGLQQSGSSEVEIEIEVATSETLEVGEAIMRWDISVINPLFFVSGLARSIVDEELLNVVESSLDE